MMDLPLLDWMESTPLPPAPRRHGHIIVGHWWLSKVEKMSGCTFSPEFRERWTVAIPMANHGRYRDDED